MNHWSFAASLMVVLAGIGGVTLAAWLGWGNWQRNGRRGKVALLEVLRFVAVAMLAFTLLRPEFVRLIQRTDPPQVVILSDSSGSMLTRDIVSTNDIITRADWLEAQTKRAFWKPLEASSEVLTGAFAAPPDLTSTNALGQVREIGTDLSGALDSVLGQQKNLKAVLLLSDGDWNLGPSPIGIATRYRDQGIPVYSVVTGQDESIPDLAMEEVAAPAYGLFGEQIAIPYTVQSHLPRDVATEVRLMQGTEQLASKKITLPANSRFRDSIMWYPREVGEFDLRLEFPVEPDEGLRDNNTAAFHIAVRVVKLTVLVVDSQPRWEYRYLRNALARDPGVALSCMLFHPNIGTGGGRDYLSAFPGSREMLSRYDVIFLGDVGVGKGQLSKKDAELIKGLVEQQGSGLVFMPGRRGNHLSLMDSPLKELMPVVLDDAKRTGVGLQNESALTLSSRGRGHLLTRFDADEMVNEQIWKMLPGFYWSTGVIKSRPGSEVLAVHSELRNQFGRIPLLAIRNAGRGKVLFMGTDSAWRWRRGVEDKFHYRFWSQVARWMAHKRHLAEKDGIRLSYTPETPKVGDRVFLQATVLDEAGFPLENGEVNGSIVSPTGRGEQLELTEVEGGWGVYSAEFSPQEGGPFEIAIDAPEHDRELETKLTVSLPKREKLGRPVNRPVLAEIASITGGESAGTDQLDQLIKKISVLPEPKPAEIRTRLWSNPWWGGAILLLLVVYWTGRKLAGLV
ncbi:MAG: hypothetical protein HN707_02220 [Verrucomicrobia bacterium]|nr:hypothetical protein [Verrucomicrobiota bacterium]MBT4900306.1 hypothetical protein [Verrucomicrobiota bacterium]MBT5619195.1 hypothetical protein [Verrucomicrobiota bacterium]MBT6788316.1 hypothetical protein [Verrucomicrobiota bacterium]MBT7733701.1 hypothetical protein [Verrucomicrobiota bacterium]